MWTRTSPRRSTVHRVLVAVKEEPGPAAPALPPIIDPNELALIQQMQIQNQSPIAAMMAQPSVSPVIHKPALPSIRTVQQARWTCRGSRRT